MKIEGMDKAKAFYGIAKDNELFIGEVTGTPLLLASKRDAMDMLALNERVVKVYLVVEDS